MTPTLTPTSTQLDAQAVAAVRRGDAGRYRELVERHERRVFAVAWSRLGDRGLAEDATQEAFIRAYRRLPLLGDDAKFSSWVSAIARNAAVSLGLRHRRELNRCDRWRLEQPTTETLTLADDANEVCSPETLRQTLAELPAAHRECLVLFYLEGKSTVEAAAALGLSESALRVRLHRARAALRARLEEKLGESLEQLRPTGSVAPGVMAAVATTPAGKGVGTGATLLGFLGKVAPFKFLGLFASAASVFPGLALQAWYGRQERRNFRDAGGFRPRLHWQTNRRMFWMLPLMMAGIFLLSHFTDKAWGSNSMMLALGVISLAMAGFGARLFVINRSGFYARNLIYSAIMGLLMLACGAGILPEMALTGGIIVMSLFIIFSHIFGAMELPQRCDYNLFLRASQGLLAETANAANPPPVAPELTRADLLAFARFLSRHFLVKNFAWRPEGLALALTKVGPGYGPFDHFWFSPQQSHLTFGWDGTVAAFCGEKDEQALVSVAEHDVPGRGELERQVAWAAAAAWRNFRAGDATGAARALGEVAEEEIFIAPPARMQVSRIIAIAILCAISGALTAIALVRAHHHAQPLSPPPAPAATAQP